MGRHGTGGSEEAREEGDTSAFWGPQDQQADSFWGPSDGQQAEAPGWPSPPDQAAVTGQWAPMPQGGPPADALAPQRDPFETTGAFAPPPQEGPGRADPALEQPFETTGAFVRPASWDDAPDATQTLGALPQDGPFDQKPGTFDQQPRSFDQNQSVFDPRPFESRGADSRNPFDNPPDRTAAYERPAFDQRPGESTGAYDPFAAESTGRFDPPGHDATGRFDPPGHDATGRFDPLGPEATARFDPPDHDGPPEPGDIKVYGEPTMVGMPAPAWAEADNGFLSSEETKGEPEPRRRRGRRGPPKDPDSLDVPSGGGGGRGRMALLSVAAVVVVLGGTVAGVKMMSSGGGAADCPGGTCAAVQSSNQPAPKASEPLADEPVEEEEPVDEPVEEEESEPARSPKPTATYSAREPRRTTSPTPKPKPTKTKQTQEPVDEPIDEATVEEAIPEETAAEEVTLDPDRATRPDNGGIPLPAATATETFQGVPSGGSVNVDFNVTSQRLTSYTATMDVTNSSEQALNTFTLSLPVRGKILSVEGATWTQDGNLLIVDLSTPIASGDSTEITLAATGRAGRPTNCGLVGGDCAVS